MDLEFWDWVAMQGDDDDPICDQCGERHVFWFVDWQIWLCIACADNLTDDEIAYYTEQAEKLKQESKNEPGTEGV